MLRSEEVRKLAPEMDPLRMGMGWKVSDLSKPQVMVESSSGHNDRTHILQASDTHQHGRHGFITAGYEYASIEYCGIGLCLHQIRNGVAVCQGVIDPIVALGDTVTHISSKISGLPWRPLWVSWE